MVLITLNKVWNRAKEMGIPAMSNVGSIPPNEVFMKIIPFKKNGNIGVIHRTPNTLNSKWTRAALFAVTLATRAAVFAAIVVPMFTPSSIVAAISKESHPLILSTSISAKMAFEERTIIVNSIPAIRYTK